MIAIINIYSEAPLTPQGSHRPPSLFDVFTNPCARLTIFTV